MQGLHRQSQVFVKLISVGQGFHCDFNLGDQLESDRILLSKDGRLRDWLPLLDKHQLAFQLITIRVNLADLVSKAAQFLDWNGWQPISLLYKLVVDRVSSHSLQFGTISVTTIVHERVCRRLVENDRLWVVRNSRVRRLVNGVLYDCLGVDSTSLSERLLRHHAKLLHLCLAKVLQSR